MTVALRTFVARLIAPEFAKQADLDAERFRYAKSQAEDLAHWCFGHSPIASECGKWLLNTIRVHFMSSAQFNADAERGIYHNAEQISDFRERLKRDESAARKPVGWGV